ncbi:hypothetical protein GWI33_001202 [Rhynchophorus ferrugineus]|uniref:Uncharacterized protein n=1 Tax=Rhynchophorus ferrugineus TaxID=354439 RepID=A0A834M144_RHYFE|nr:hypothetical protein GWI33_001202 [Rhynchophorus ferrugineus]
MFSRWEETESPITPTSTAAISISTNPIKTTSGLINNSSQPPARSRLKHTDYPIIGRFDGPLHHPRRPTRTENCFRTIFTQSFEQKNGLKNAPSPFPIDRLHYGLSRDVGRRPSQRGQTGGGGGVRVEGASAATRKVS